MVEWGYQKSFADYAQWLWRADILPVTSRQEFFGAGVVQALYCGCQALLPDRLAYPEHVPDGSIEAVLYREGDSLVERLRELLTGKVKARANLEGHVARYDWGRMATVYDDFFAGLVAGAGKVVPEIALG